MLPGKVYTPVVSLMLSFLLSCWKIATRTTRTWWFVTPVLDTGYWIENIFNLFELLPTQQDIELWTFKTWRKKDDIQDIQHNNAKNRDGVGGGAGERRSLNSYKSSRTPLTINQKKNTVSQQQFKYNPSPRQTTFDLGNLSKWIGKELHCVR